MNDVMNEDASSRPILVGIDGSDSSLAALHWAANQAKLTGAPLKVISTWQYPSTVGWAELLPGDIDFNGDTQRVLDESLKEVLGDDQSCQVTTEVIQGHPAVTLVELSRSASLVVVGSRGHGKFVGMLLGSVSEFLATHAHCPVLIIRDDEPAEDPKV